VRRQQILSGTDVEKSKYKIAGQRSVGTPIFISNGKKVSDEQAFGRKVYGRHRRIYGNAIKPGIAEVKAIPERSRYLPHHRVVNPSRPEKTTRIRVVINV